MYVYFNDVMIMNFPYIFFLYLPWNNFENSDLSEKYIFLHTAEASQYTLFILHNYIAIVHCTVQCTLNRKEHMQSLSTARHTFFILLIKDKFYSE
jgi:hypothetical protein